VAALPIWVQATLDHYPPDEARRRLSFAYRLVFPYPKEIKAGRQPSVSPARGQASSPPRPSSSPAKGKSDATTTAPF
jgi:hypothetical protein